MTSLPPLGSLASAETLAGDGGAGQTDRLALLLQHASAAVRSYTRLTITRETSTAALRGVWGPYLELPEWPVVSVASVETGGRQVSGWGFDGVRGLNRSRVAAGHDASHDYDAPRSRQGATGLGAGGSWGGPRTTWQVTYTHGWADDDIPADIRAVTEGLAVGALLTPIGIRQESIGSYNVTYAVETLGAVPRITLMEAAVLDRYRRRSL